MSLKFLPVIKTGFPSFGIHPLGLFLHLFKLVLFSCSHGPP